MVLDSLTKQNILDAQQGNCEAFEYIYNKFYREVYSVARYMLRSDSKAEDVLQETFIKVFNKLPELKSAEAFSSWLYIITQNECRMMMRRKDEKILYLDTQDSEYIQLVDIEPVLPVLDFEKAEDQLFIKKEVEKLPIQHRTAIIYFYYLHLSIKEISQLLSCNENTIKSRLFAGRSILKKSIVKFQEQLGTTLTFSVLPLSQILGNNVLDQSISDNAAKTIFIYISNRIGLGIGHISFLNQMRTLVNRLVKRVAGTSILAIFLTLLISFSCVAAVTLYMTGALGITNKYGASTSLTSVKSLPTEIPISTEQTQNSWTSPSPIPENQQTTLPSAQATITPPQKNDITETKTGTLAETIPTASIIPTSESITATVPSPIPAVPATTPEPEPTSTIPVAPTPTPVPTIPATPTAADIAATITGIASPVKGDTYLSLPSILAGYSVAIKSSDNEGIIALDGKITPVDSQQTIAIRLTITKTEDNSTADTGIVYVVVPHFLSSSADMLLTSISGTKLSGVLVNEDTSISHQDGISESNQTLLIVTIDSASISSAEFLPVVDHATVTAVTATNDAGTGGVKSGDYVSVQANIFNFTSCKFLWIKVVSEDMANTRYYSLYVQS